LLRVQLAPFGGIDTKKITVRGPEVFLTPPAMQSLGLIMHELATNATKHGALSTPAGSVAIVWREQGGPPVGEPSRKGFGQVMFERIGASLDGSISTDFRPEGFVCTVTVAGNNLIAEARLGAGAAPQSAARPY
jgi:two-component sensor histidine kinase